MFFLNSAYGVTEESFYDEESSICKNISSFQSFMASLFADAAVAAEKKDVALYSKDGIISRTDNVSHSGDDLKKIIEL